MFSVQSCKKEQKLLLPPKVPGPILKGPFSGKHYHGGFSWTHNDKSCSAGFVKKEGRDAGYYFVLEYMNKLPDKLSDKEKALFRKKEKLRNGKAVSVYKYTYGDVPKNQKMSNEERLEEERSKLRKLEEKKLMRKFKQEKEQTKPLEMTLKELAEIIKTKKVIFLTGAGISLDAKIQTMQNLHDNLGISEDEPIDDFVKNIIHNPLILEKKIMDFIDSVRRAKPTPIHYALKNIAFSKGIQIMTGNFDLLHEKSGIWAYNVDDKNFEKDWNKNVIKQIDAIICFGTSYDFRAVLGKYKKYNPDGLIIAVNAKQPNYLGNEDFFVKGDLLKVVSQLEKLIN